MKILLNIILNKIKTKIKVFGRWIRIRNHLMDKRYNSKTPRIFVITAWSVLLIGTLSYICYQALTINNNQNQVEQNVEHEKTTYDLILELFEE